MLHGGSFFKKRPPLVAEGNRKYDGFFDRFFCSDWAGYYVS